MDDSLFGFKLTGCPHVRRRAGLLLLCGRRLYATPGGERAIIKEQELQPAEKGANVTLWITPSSDFYRYPIHLPNGITTTCLVQTYLDLQAGGERGREAAEHLLTQKLKPLWNEWKSGSP